MRRQRSPSVPSQFIDKFCEYAVSVDISIQDCPSDDVSTALDKNIQKCS